MRIKDYLKAKESNKFGFDGKDKFVEDKFKQIRMKHKANVCESRSRGGAVQTQVSLKMNRYRLDKVKITDYN